MKRRFSLLPGILLAMMLLANIPARASDQHVWMVPSPDHEQTFAYGSEQSRVWTVRGHRLALLLNFTNDPYVDRNNPREYDSYTFHFPEVSVGSDGRTFYYHTPDGRSLPVARNHPDFLGVDEIRLLPTCDLLIKKPHGYLSLTLVVRGYALSADSEQ